MEEGRRRKGGRGRRRRRKGKGGKKDSLDYGSGKGGERQAAPPIAYLSPS